MIWFFREPFLIRYVSYVCVNPQIMLGSLRSWAGYSFVYQWYISSLLMCLLSYWALFQSAAWQWQEDQVYRDLINKMSHMLTLNRTTVSATHQRKTITVNKQEKQPIMALHWVSLVRLKHLSFLKSGTGRAEEGNATPWMNEINIDK